MALGARQVLDAAKQGAQRLRLGPGQHVQQSGDERRWRAWHVLERVGLQLPLQVLGVGAKAAAIEREEGVEQRCHALRRLEARCGGRAVAPSLERAVDLVDEVVEGAVDEIGQHLGWHARLVGHQSGDASRLVDQRRQVGEVIAVPGLGTAPGGVALERAEGHHPQIEAGRRIGRELRRIVGRDRVGGDQGGVVVRIGAGATLATGTVQPEGDDVLVLGGEPGERLEGLRAGRHRDAARAVTIQVAALRVTPSGPPRAASARRT